MEVQQLPQQSVQINLNNKIITLHNVTIVKNPRIVKVDATQYSNLLKGASTGGNLPQIKFVNGGAVKLPMPSLVPMKSPTLVRSNPLTNCNSNSQQNSVIVNQIPVIKQVSPAGNYIQPHVIKTIQTAPANPNGLVQLKQISAAPQTLVSPVKIQAVPVKNTVIISPPKVQGPSPQKVHVQGSSPQKPQVQVSSPQKPQNSNLIKVVQRTTTPPPLIQTAAIQPVVIPPNQTSVITAPINIDVTSNAALVNIVSNQGNQQPILPIKTNVIVSPSLKTKSPQEACIQPDIKKPCTKLEFQCIFCKATFYNEPQLLMQHMKEMHADKIPQNIKIAENEVVDEIKPQVNIEPVDVTKTNDCDEKMETDSTESSMTSSDEEMSEDLDEDDESEVNDLIMDLENPQEDEEAEEEASSSSEDENESDSESESDGESSQDRSNTPESPEFEEHIAEGSGENNLSSNDDDEEYTDEKYDLDILAILLEPFVDLQCSDDFDENSQEENEAMKLYREAMEINYEQNGIKKRGRRKSRAPKVAASEPLSMNGILANLLDTSIKIPQGPGRGRRKEVNEQELEQDRSNGICFFQCTQCDKSFKFAGDLAKHVRSHTISSPYRCSICGKVFTHIGSLNTHLRIHSGERPYKCKFCDKSFTQSNSLMVHVKSHLSNKPFSCTQCNKGFLNASSLALHQKTHTGPVAVVVCPIDTCGKEFRDNNLLEEHMQTHKQSLLYQCSQCLEKFEQACQLVQHVKIHVGDKPFQCTICSRAFTQPGSLNTHLRIHTGEKPFSCTLCPKRFTQASSLSVHMKIHGEKEFKCEICNKSYNQEAFLLKHKLKHQENNNTDSSEVGHEMTDPQE